MQTTAKKSKKNLSLEDKDKRYLWHPFTQMQDWEKEKLLIIDSAEGCYLKDTEGKRYLDGVSSLWCNVHGHQVPEIDAAIGDQLKRVAHSTFLGLTHEPAILLAERLIKIAPRGLQRVFYSDSGSEAVEIALKIAFQYWQQQAGSKKTKFLRLTNAYHGDTLGAVAVGGIELFHRIYGPLLIKSFAAPAPYRYRWGKTQTPEKVRDEALEQLEKILKPHHSQIAALVMEPLMQGAAGMIDQPEGYISAVRELTKRYNVLLIFDEVATGFGRTGKMFASEHEKVSPDLLAVAKGLTGGYLPLAATLTTEEIYRAFLGRYDEFKTFFHGHTFTANPLACRAALASLDLFETRKLLQNVKKQAAFMSQGLRRFLGIPIVGDIRQKGLMAGIELVQDSRTKKPFDPAAQVGVKVIQKARAKGAVLRPLGSVIVLMPPLSIKTEEMKSLLDITYESIKEVNEETSNQKPVTRI